MQPEALRSLRDHSPDHYMLKECVFFYNIQNADINLIEIGML